MKKLLLGLLCITSCSYVYAYSIDSPQTVMQGDPLVVSFIGDDASKITTVVMGKQAARPIFLGGKYRALFGVDINHPIGALALIVREGSTITRTLSVEVTKRPHEEQAFSIPQNLGGNTQVGEKKVVSGLAQENALLQKLFSNPKTLFTKPFRFPLATTTVTDVYGYTRTTEGTAITHKGVDFKASVGTPVYAMNRGVVRLAKKLTVYGNTVVIDHGNGISTMYMHLSSISSKLTPGTLVERGKHIGDTGKTGYALGPHLHVSVRLFGVSVDPLVFMGYVSDEPIR